MKLKVQTLLIIGTSMVLFLAFLMLVTRPLLIRDGDHLDRERLELKMDMVHNYFESQKEGLNRISLDWAVWDDTFEYVDGNDRNYVERNLMDATFDNLEIMYMLFYDKNNQYINGSGIEPIDSSMKQTMQTLIDNTKDQELPFLTSTPKGLALIDIEKIYPSNGEGPSNGKMVMIRLIEQPFFETLEMNLSLQLESFTQVTKQSSRLKDIQIISNKQLLGTLYIEEITAGKYIEVSMLQNRDYFLQKLESINNLFITFIVMILMIVLLIYISLDRLIVSRVTTLSGQLRDIQESKDGSTRLGYSRKNKDEIYVLEQTVNDMMQSLEESHDEIKRLAYLDFLTGLPNRFRLQRDFESFAQSSERLGTLFLDLDGFKAINDVYGHAAGDSLLQAVASRLTTLMQDTPGMVARIGGDEFIILVQHQQQEELSSFAQLITEVISEPYEIQGITMHITSSLGISQLPKDGQKFYELLNHADTAMYISKKNGKNQFTFYENNSENLS